MRRGLRESGARTGWGPVVASNIPGNSDGSGVNVLRRRGGHEPSKELRGNQVSNIRWIRKGPFKHKVV